jgi:ribosomal protein S18 acetylase RimI-like enzyme
MKALEFETDLLVAAGRCEIERHPDRVIQRSPAEPDFWFGNRVIFTEPPGAAAPLIAQFHADLPHARHICIGWDIPDLPRADVEAVFAGSGLAVEQGDVLTLAGPVTRAAPPEGIVLRELRPGEEAQSIEIALADRAETAIPEAEYRAYLERRWATRRGQIAAGLGQWYGAFDGALLVGDMGVFHNARLIRYQSVQTRASHRRRGICTALLGHALEAARARAPEATAVIVADTGSAAGRLYRRAGFRLAETTVSAVRPPVTPG